MVAQDSTTETTTEAIADQGREHVRHVEQDKEHTWKKNLWPAAW